VEYSYNG